MDFMVKLGLLAVACLGKYTYVHFYCDTSIVYVHFTRWIHLGKFQRGLLNLLSFKKILI